MKTSRGSTNLFGGPQVGMGFVGFVFGTMPGVGFTDNMGQSAQNYGLFCARDHGN